MKVVSVVFSAMVGVATLIRRASILGSLLVTLVAACSSSGQSGTDAGENGGGGGASNQGGSGAQAVGGTGGGQGGSGGVTTTAGCLTTTPCTKTSVCPAGEECNTSVATPVCANLYCQSEGGICSDDAQCKKGLACVGNGSVTDGPWVVCIDPSKRTGRTVGDICGEFIHNTAPYNEMLACAPGLFCTASCFGGSGCSGVCEQQKGEGGPCGSSSECAAGLFCSGADGGTSGTCHSKTICQPAGCVSTAVSSKCGTPDFASCVYQMVGTGRNQCFRNGYATSTQGLHETIYSNGVVCATVDEVSTSSTDYTVTYRDATGTVMATVAHTASAETDTCPDGTVKTIDFTLCGSAGGNGGPNCTAGTCAPGSAVDAGAVDAGTCAGVIRNGLCCSGTCSNGAASCTTDQTCGGTCSNDASIRCTSKGYECGGTCVGSMASCDPSVSQPSVCNGAMCVQNGRCMVGICVFIGGCA